MQGGGSNQGLNFNNDVLMAPASERMIGYGRLSYEVSSGLKLFAEGHYARSEGSGVSLPPRNEQNTPIVIRLDNPYIPAALRTEITRLNALPQNAANQITSFNVGRNSRDLGNQYYNVVTKTARGVLGFDAELGDGWTLDGAVIYGHNNYDQQVSGTRVISNFNFATDVVSGPNGPACRAALAGNPAAAGCVPLNIFGEGAPSAQARAYVLGSPHTQTKYEQVAANLNIAGEPFSTWAGPVSVAAGLEYRHERQETWADPIAERAGYDANNARSFQGRFNVREGYFEAIVPLLKDFAIARSLDLQGAVRFTDYSTSGGVTTWKLGATYVPIEGLLVRGTMSRDIRAPNLYELNTPPVSTILNRAFAAGVAGGPAGQVATQNLVGGNAGLQPEKADTRTIGLSYAPPFLPGLQLSVDYFNITVNGAIASLDPQVIINFCTGLTQTTAENRSYYCNFISTGPANGAYVYSIETPFLNLNEIQRSGFDMEASYRLPLSKIAQTLGGSLTARFSGTYFEHYRENVNGGGYIERAGETSALGTPRFLTTSSLSYDSRLFSTSLQMRTISAGKYNSTFTEGVQINNNTVPGRTYLNLSATLRPTERFEVFGVINNLTDRDPPFAPQNFGFPTVNVYFDMIGRSYRAGVRYKF